MDEDRQAETPANEQDITGYGTWHYTTDGLSAEFWDGLSRQLALDIDALPHVEPPTDTPTLIRNVQHAWLIQRCKKLLLECPELASIWNELETYLCTTECEAIDSEFIGECLDVTTPYEKQAGNLRAALEKVFSRYELYELASRCQ